MSISIGSIELDDFEVPSVIQYGGTQRLVTHYLGSGRRMIDALGPEEADIRFSGVITGPDARTRAQSLDELRRRGAITRLHWSGFDIPVIIRQCLTEYRSEFLIQYNIVCAVIDNEPTADVVTPVATRRILEDRLAEVQQIISIDLSAVKHLLGRLETILSQPNVSTALASTRTELDQALNELSVILRNVEAQLSSFDSTEGTNSSVVPAAQVLRVAAHVRSIISSLKTVSTLSREGD